jgi:oxygen-dependent protoporphyrinogen oxidase
LKIVVVGGGISGLSTCYFLSKFARQKNQAIDITLVEAKKRLGGKITTDVSEEMIIEGGPDSFFTLKSYALDMCKELGLDSELLAANPESRGTYILNDGKLSKLPEGTETGTPTRLVPFLQTDLLSFSGKVRALMDLVIPKRKESSDESIGSFIGRRFGKEFLVKIVEPLYAGIFAGDVYQLSAKAVLPRLVDMESTRGSLIRGMHHAVAIRRNNARLSEGREKIEPSPTFVTLKGGLLQLVERITSSLGDSSILLNTKVSEVSESSEQNKIQFQVTLEDNDRSMEADLVVLSTPAYAASKLLWRLDGAIASLLDEILYVSTATVSLAFRKNDVRETIRGHGFLVPRTEGELVTGCTWESSKWPGHAPLDVILARCYLGWFGHEEFTQLDDATLVQKVEDFLNRVAGISAQPILTRICRWDKALPQYNLGHLDRVASLDLLLNNHRGLFLTGAAYSGVGLPDCIHHGYLTAQKVFKTIEESKEHFGITE